MRPPRIAILVLFFSATLFLLCRSVFSVVTHHSNPLVVVVPTASPTNPATITSPVPVVPSPPASKHHRYGSFFSFSSPLSLFPPNAIITLTDDNGTSFPARPAAFGPPFPNKGLSGQLWIGSGFADDNLQEGEGEGELGCSDLPGWDDNRQNVRVKVDPTSKRLSGKSESATATGKTRNKKRHDGSLGGISSGTASKGTPPGAAPAQPVNDGTDDYLVAGLKSTGKSQGRPVSNTEFAHADIQSLQEAAEIAGKVVLLSRGGCGFAEKVMWAQRRGAIAVIVGDNQRGGPLIQMYARGDTSNITIPSVFTSRTTAHILSSLMHPGSFLEDTVDENGNSAVKVQKSDPKTDKGKAKAKLKAKAKPKTSAEKKNPPLPKTKKPKASRSDTGLSWFKRLFGWGGSPSSVSDVRAPKSGQLDWVLVEDFDDAKDKMIQAKMDGAKSGASYSTLGDDGAESNEDSFQIGVQDWRDPDLVDPVVPDSDPPRKGGKSQGDSKSGRTAPEDGRINTPGSGQYGKNGAADSEGFISRLFGEDDGSGFSDGWPDDQDSTPDEPVTAPNPVGEPHEGLWVTITPSSSASPFLDTLLVLVVSPLITLTVVYALLILRARIRRRRWRAPKSVVDRLPVRTYHTVTASPATSPRIPSPTSSSPRTPLLQQPAQEGPSRPRPRSRTSTGIPDPNDRLRPDSGIPPQSRSASRTREQREMASGASQWKKYMGRQVECVVCLEEYVDGVSRVMSLPCGHEFHAECITPWLTTRRRTCPICKGDVVRSLARGTTSGPRYEPYRDDDSSGEEEDQVVESGSSSQDAEQDLETGILSEPRQPRSRPSSISSWFNNLVEQGQYLWRNRTPSQDDRDRDR